MSINSIFEQHNQQILHTWKYSLGSERWFWSSKEKYDLKTYIWGGKYTGLFCTCICIDVGKVTGRWDCRMQLKGIKQSLSKAENT